ncbi:MAG: glycosyltransferase family 39 protein, partial [Chitinophagales bacterium]
MNHQRIKSTYFSPQQLVGYCFLVCLVIPSAMIALKSFNMRPFHSNNTHILWAIGAGIFGALFVYMSRNQLLKIDQQTWRTQQKKTKIIGQRFSKTHPLLNKIPIVGFLYKKWDAEPFLYKLALVLLCVLAAAIYLYDLTYYAWLPDEPLVISAAKGYLETGTYTKWSFWMDQIGTEEYPRAWMHSWMVAQSFRFFGVSEWSARIVSVILGLVFVPTIYGVAYFFLRNRPAALTLTLVCILHPYFIVYFRRTRMYALWLPVFSLLIYFSYQSLTKRKTYNWAVYKNNPLVSKYLNYNWSWVISTLLLLYFTVEVHKLSLVLLPALFLFFFYLLVLKKQIRLLPILFIGFVLFFWFSNRYGILENIQKRFTFFEVYKPDYVKHLFLSPFQPTLSISILSVGLLCIWWTKHNARLILVYLLLSMTIVLFTFSIDYSPNNNFRYVMHVIPFSCLLVIGVLFKINQLFASKYLRWVLPITIILLSIGNFKYHHIWIYKVYPEAQFTQRAYPTILQNIIPEKEGIIALYLQEAYMQGWGKKVEYVRDRK